MGSAGASEANNLARKRPGKHKPSIVHLDKLSGASAFATFRSSAERTLWFVFRVCAARLESLSPPSTDLTCSQADPGHAAKAAAGEGSSLPLTPTRRARPRTRSRPLGPQKGLASDGIQKPHSPSQGRGVASFLAGAPPRRAGRARTVHFLPAYRS